MGDNRRQTNGLRDTFIAFANVMAAEEPGGHVVLVLVL